MLQSWHDRAAFNCGEPELDEYLRRYAGQNDRGDTARAFVLVEDGDNRVLGYFTLSMTQVNREMFPGQRGLPRGVPAALIGRLALDRSLQGQKRGSLLLMAALRRCEEASRHVAARAVIVDALQEKACDFYLHMGFISFQDDRMRLFIPMAQVRKLMLGS